VQRLDTQAFPEREESQRAAAFSLRKPAYKAQNSDTTTWRKRDGKNSPLQSNANPAKNFLTNLSTWVKCVFPVAGGYQMLELLITVGQIYVVATLTFGALLGVTIIRDHLFGQ
jgi:hypothetical protein